MSVKDIQIIGNELAIIWPDGRESYMELTLLRRSCPCAGCKGEMDIMGNVYKNPTRPLSDAACQIVKLQLVGGYAVQPVWKDGHSTGLYSWEYLAAIASQAGIN